MKTCAKIMSGGALSGEPEKEYILYMLYIVKFFGFLFFFFEYKATVQPVQKREFRSCQHGRSCYNQSAGYQKVELLYY